MTNFFELKEKILNQIEKEDYSISIACLYSALADIQIRWQLSELKKVEEARNATKN